MLLRIDDIVSGIKKRVDPSGRKGYDSDDGGEDDHYCGEEDGCGDIEEDVHATE